MNSKIRYSEKELVTWIKKQLEKREFMNGVRLTESEVWDCIYEILFLELNFQVEEIEQYFIPFGQAGFLSARRKLEIMLFILQKDYGHSFWFLQEIQDISVIREETIEQIYLTWALEGRLYLSEEEKKEFFVQVLADQMGLGVVAVLQRLALDGIMLGVLCPALEKENAEKRIAICNHGKVIWLPFLEIEEKLELIRIMKQIIAKENKGELTMIEPFWECVREDGSCITAVRPPAGEDWGIRILYGASRKEQILWER